MRPIEAYNRVAASEALNQRLDRGQNATIELYGEEYGKKWILKSPRAGENPNLIQNEIGILRTLQETGVVPEIHPDYLDDSWGKCEEYAMLMINSAASLGDYAEAAIMGIIPINVFRDIIMAAQESLKSIHEVGVIHNDLHANNLVVTLAPKGQWQVYVIDFGWSYLEGKPPEWMEEERAWMAEDYLDDLKYLQDDLNNRSNGEDEDYLDCLSHLE